MIKADEPLDTTLHGVAAVKNLIPIKEPLRTILLWAFAGLIFVGLAVGFTYVPTKHDLGVTHQEIKAGLDDPDKARAQ
ncbi:hypothetical protein SAMN05444156_3072 [Verrucomicrobium sp. GAS474]|uniref:hypothetical protein n=1 Tax=Verrucomicrobium sp. GAS474 TaxID=1882831 RepID=UPI00087C0165|nr:hypothetical protein [Verrucomicrobium sp. GAS474]SDU28581.1 hypothetical protein SAMN05444156_3072 [Verrucomicrobium sp. GAS474]